MRTTKREKGGYRECNSSNKTCVKNQWTNLPAGLYRCYQSHSLHRTCFYQNQASAAMLGWPRTAVSCKNYVQSGSWHYPYSVLKCGWVSNWGPIPLSPLPLPPLILPWDAISLAELRHQLWLLRELHFSSWTHYLRLFHCLCMGRRGRRAGVKDEHMHGWITHAGTILSWKLYIAGAVSG